MKAFYGFFERLLPSTPGTGNYAFQPRMGLPGVTIGGPGTDVANPLTVLQGEQLYYGQAQTVNGLEGLQFDQIESGPIYDLDELYARLAEEGMAQNG